MAKKKDETTDLLDVDFILHAEHGPNASAFAARVTAGLELDFFDDPAGGFRPDIRSNRYFIGFRIVTCRQGVAAPPGSAFKLGHGG